jgi:hypothetical protein
MMDKVKRKKKISVCHIQLTALYSVEALFVSVQCGTALWRPCAWNVAGLLDK